MKLRASEPTKAGYYIEPTKNGDVYGWNLYWGNINIATMTACDLDLEAKLDITRRIVESFNKVI
jgi:hypothetical protein